MIVVEGYDCTGKSTLVDKIQGWTGFTTTHTGGPPQDLNHVRRCLARHAVLMTQPVVQDRVTHVSEGVYGMLTRPSMAALALSRVSDLRFARLLIYCRPDIRTILDRLVDHRVKAHDTDEHIKYVLASAQAMIAIYDTVIEMARPYVDVIFYDYKRSNTDTQLQPLIEEIKP